MKRDYLRDVVAWVITCIRYFAMTGGFDSGDYALTFTLILSSYSGNWSVDLQAGSQFGYKLLFVVLLSGIGAVILQVNYSSPLSLSQINY